MEGIEYWVKITDKGAIRRAASLGLASYKVPIVKVMDNGHDDRLIITDSVFCNIHASYELFLLREHVKRLLLTDLRLIKINNTDKKSEILLEFLYEETCKIIDASQKGIASSRIFPVDIVGVSCNYDIPNIGSIRKVPDINKIRKLDKFLSNKRASSCIFQLPDEIDLYNFFEKWGGYARCYDVFGFVTSCHTIKAYSEKYQDSNGIEYFIDDNRYHAIRFKAWGTFLVSERRYHELKAKKGETK